ncbi:tetratricopeptide repeat protein, partial [Myxococcota bacterium]|nr:tetratricopeptide repeat protein [Myxococcota bacterium]
AALTELKKAVIADPHHTNAHFELGLIYLKKASTILDITKRAQCFQGDARKEKEEEAQALLAMAKKHFLQSARNKQLTSKAHNNVSAIEIHFGNNESAIEHAKKSTSDLVYQDSYVANTNIGWAYYHLKQFKKSIPYFKQALLIQSKYCLARYRMGRSLFELGEYSKAEKALLRTVKQGPPCNSIQEAWLYLGLAQLKLGKHKNAVFALSRCKLISDQSCVSQKCEQHLKVIITHEQPHTEDEQPAP